MKKFWTAPLLALTLALLLAACGGMNPFGGGEKEDDAPPQKEIDLTAFYEEATQGDNWPALMLAEGEVLDAFYAGLSNVETKQCVIGTAMISAAVGEMALVEVENAEDVETVEGIFQARIDYQVGDENNPGGAWYPETIRGWEENSRIVSNGNYVMMAVGDGAEDAVESFNALFA